jgi:hypothetical protein
MKKLKVILYLFIVNLFLFSFVVILIESAFRFAGIPFKAGYIPNENSFALFDPDLGWSYMPNKSTIHEAGDGKIKVPVSFDDNGIRVQSADIRLDSNQPSVLFIGGSFTMGHGLSYEESFVGKFNAFDEVPYQTVNLGVQGYERNGNYDRRMLIPTAKFLGTKPKFALDDNDDLYLQKRPLLYEDYVHSYLFDFLKMRIGSLLGTFPPYPEKLTKKIILKMKHYSNKHEAHFIVLNWRWSTDDYDLDLTDIGIDVIDTLDRAPEEWMNMVLLGGIHPDADAGEHATRILFDYLMANNLI